MRYITLAILFLCQICYADVTAQEVTNAMVQNNSPQVAKLSLEVLQKHPNSAKAHYFLGEAYYHEGKFNLSHQQLEIAKSLAPDLSFTNQPTYFYNLYHLTQSTNNTKSIVTNSITNIIGEELLCWILGLILAATILIICYMICIKMKYKNSYEEKDNIDEYNIDEIMEDNTFRKTYYTPSQTSHTAIPPRCSSSSTRYHDSGAGFTQGLMTGVILDEVLSNHNDPNMTTNNYYNNNTSQENNYTSDNSNNWDNSSSSYDSSSSSNDW